MKFVKLPALLIILINSFFLSFTIYSQVPATKYEFYITLSDGVQLDCSKFVPATPPPANGYPCIICCHGYGLNKEDSYSIAEDESSYGFYMFCYSMRGQGHSGGLSNFISTTEMNDLMQVIQYVKDDANTNDERIAVIGGSQGGMIPFMAACNGAKIRCLVTELASSEFASDWIANGCIKMTFLWTLGYDESVVRYSEEVKQLRRWAVSDDKDDWDRLVTTLPVNRDYIDKVKYSQVPMLISNTWQDKFFNTNGMIKIKDELKVPYKMYFGAVSGHGGDVSEDEDRFHEKLVDDWFYYWLLDKPNNSAKGNKFIYSTTEFTGSSVVFSRFDSPVWPPAGVNNIKFYFNPNNRLSSFQNTDNSQPYFNLRNEIRDPNMSLLNAVNYGFTGPFDHKFAKDEIKFDSDPLEKDTRMVGTPQAMIYYSSNADICQFNFQIWEVQESGLENFVTSVNYTDRNYSAGSVKDKLVDGDAYGHIFKKGSRIRVIVTNLDTRPNDPFLRSFPYVLPVMKNAVDNIYMNKDNPSYISIPLLQ